MTRAEAVDALVAMGARHCGSVVPRSFWDGQPADWNFEATVRFHREHRDGVTEVDGKPCSCTTRADGGTLHRDAAAFAVSRYEANDAPAPPEPAWLDEIRQACALAPVEDVTAIARLTHKLSDDTQAAIVAKYLQPLDDPTVRAAVRDCLESEISRELAARVSLRDSLRWDLWCGGVPLDELDKLDDGGLIQRARSFIYDRRRAEEDHERAELARRYSVN